MDKQILFRCSQLGKLMTEPQGKSNAEKFSEACTLLNKYTSYFYLMANKETKTALKKWEQIEKTKQLVAELEPIRDKVELSETCKTYLTEVYIGLKYGRTKEITSKYSTPKAVVDKLSSEINTNWYKANRERLLK